MTTSSLDKLKEEAVNSYIDFTPSEIELINSSKSFDEFDETMRLLVTKYNEHYKSE